MNKSIASFIKCVLPVIIITLCGCAHYSTGIGTKIPFNRIYIAPAENDSFAPQAQALLTEQIRKKILSDANLTLAKNDDTSEATLNTKIIHFCSSASATETNDSMAARMVDVKMTAEITLTDDNNKVLINKHHVSANVNIPMNGDYEETQYQAMPILTQKLTDKIYILISTPW